ncbi:glycosyltransferase family 2 protein [Rhabdobacter roseus]|uniref:Cellulose synthase/poly-beta-1,6-N-acetylglucosamine synthase-like glycosyltransferase n=1 Tax=Rhabdobacter roseus TaxID=1655419 RepID=A0A840U096_9BACT|nr:glycosyltransferase family 2 protein [Rhabdobacter roseus]MBB5287322.1 cellulose synthase/poly-beta-1,6-N-acetylglucosamine synthase-like glycosyltransferase [Rhabdobacter roseus]
MKLALEILFWLGIFLVLYTYIGYGVLVWALVKIRKAMGISWPPANDPTYLPPVTLVVPAYNERAYIETKLHNSLSLDYPAGQLQLLFVTEGSTDGTTEFLEAQRSKYPAVRVMGGTERRGKIEAMNMAMPQITTPLVIFTDANTKLNTQAIKNIIRHFKNPKVGAVAGEKRIEVAENEAAAGAGEGLYWKYESFLKKLDTELYSVVGAAGELFAVRTDLFGHVEKDTLLDDFVISLRIAGQGYRVIYEPEAYAIERPSFSITDEQKRKIRIAAGGFQAIGRLTHLLNVFRYGWLSFQYISHRAMRWAVAPFCLIIIFLANIPLAFLDREGWLAAPVYQVLLGAQVLFYGAALVGNALENRKVRVKLLFVPYYFSFMNWCAILGYLRYRRGTTSGIWEKVRRAE